MHIPAMCVTVRCRARRDGSIYYSVTASQKNCPRKRYEANYSEDDPFAHAMWLYLRDTHLYDLAFKEIIRCHDDRDPDTKIFVFV